MNLYLVSKSSQQESRTGVIEVALMTVFGVYTTQDRAEHIAAKNDAVVTTFVADQETLVLANRWLNPGYVNGG